MKKNQNWSMFSKKGGEATKEKYGVEHYKKIGKKGHAKVKATRGEDYFRVVLPQKSKEARERRKFTPSIPQTNSLSRSSE